jgi:PLP dependent protein
VLQSHRNRSHKSEIERSAMFVPHHDPAAALEVVRHDIDLACGEAGRPPESVSLLAVSKTYGPDAIEQVIAAGQRAFGENRVQEANAKWPALRELYQDLELHLVGALQSNKVGEAITLFDAIHSVDRPSVCSALAKQIQKKGRSPLLFVQVNTGAEPQKAGVLPEHADAFVAACRTSYGLEISGLMCIPPVDEAPGPHFALTAKIAKRNGLKLLSMGMSADFALAIRFGATHVRVGTAIFGHRPDKRQR